MNNIPEQLRPLSEKGKSFIRDSALAFASMASASAKDKKNDELAWDYFNGKIDKSKFDYLTKVGDLVLPSSIRRTSIQRPPLNLLISQQSRRPFVFSTIVCDDASIAEKFKNKYIFGIKEVQKKIKEGIAEFEIAYKKLLRQEQELQQKLQQEPQTEEEAQIQQQIIQQLPEIETAIKMLKEEFEERLIISKKDIQKINEYLTYDYREMKEMLAQKGVEKIRQKHSAKEHSTEFFTDKIVSGKGRFYVDYIPGQKGIIYEALDSMKVYHPSVPGIKYIEDGDWVLIEDYISYGMLIDQHGDAHELTDDVLQKLSYFKDYSAGQDVGQPNANVYTGSASNENGINRKRVWWKSPRKVYIKYTPNKHSKDKYFRHFINDENVYNVKPDISKGEKVETRYIYDLFMATIIDNKYVVDGRRVENPLRMEDSYSRVQLPVIGRSYSSYNDEPYSLIWNTKDIQDLWDIVNYHRELYIAASGVKGQVIDLAQKPKSMSIQEHQYHKKLGNLYIETVDKSGRKVSSPYNQWKDYDDTLTPAIQYLENILMSLENTCRETMGVSRQRMGQTVNSDQVGTSEMARDQSALITEILYYESDQIEARALRRALNLMAKHIWKDQTLLQFTNPDLTTEIVKIPANLLNKSDWDIIVMNNTNDERNMQEIKQLAFRQHEKNMLQFKHIIQMYNKKSVVELQKSVVRWSEEAEELARESQQNAQEAAERAEQAKIQMENEFKGMIEQEKSQIEQMKIQLDQLRLKMEEENNKMTSMLKNKDIDTRREVELLKILSNRNVEMDHLTEQERSNKMNEQLRLIQLQLQAVEMEINSQLALKDDEIEMKQVSSKEKIEEKKMRDKNRPKN